MRNLTKLHVAALPAKVYNDFLNEILINLGLSHKECSVTIDGMSEKDVNYTGEIYRVTVKHPGKGVLSLIVKLPPQNLARRTHMVSRPSFVREFEFYEKIFPMFIKFQVEKGIDIRKDGFYEVPKCFKSLKEEPFEGFFFNDLTASGFEMFSRFKDLTADHVNRVMEVLGKFHAISFALKDQRPKAFEKFRNMKDIIFLRDDISMDLFTRYFSSVKEQAFGVFDVNDDQDLVKQAKNALSTDFPELMKSCVTAKFAEPYAVICHGDCWNNNIMYRYESGVPIECRLLDWQVMRYASPVLDLMYYIFGCTSKELRDKHYTEFMNVYYKSLSDFLTRLGSDPAKLFNRQAFNDQLKKFGKFGLVWAILLLPMITSNPEECPDLNEISEKFNELRQKGERLDEKIVQFTTSNSIGAYRKRMKGVFQDMYDFGYI